jgi:hypothetical protein
MALIDRRLYVALLLHRSKVYAAVASRDCTVQEVQYRKQLKRGREGAEKGPRKSICVGQMRTREGRG